jgi:hypothetical protein
MSQFYEYNWPAASANGIATFQATIANTPLNLNGSSVNKTSGQINFIDFGIVPRITLNSLQNISAINFIITGYQNGVFISETLAGPNNNTVTSVNCFDSIQSIIASGTTAGGSSVQVGVGSTGYFPIVLLNTAKQNTSFINYALNMVAAAANPATYQLFLSLKNNLGMGKYDDLTAAANGNFIAPAVAATASQLIQSSSLAQNLLVRVGPNANGSTLKFQFLQL